MCCQRQLKFNTDVGKAYVRSEGQLCQSLYAADVTHSQLLSRAATCYTPNLENTLQHWSSIPRFRLTRTFSPRCTPRGYLGSLVPQSPHRVTDEGANLLRRRRLLLKQGVQSEGCATRLPLTRLLQLCAKIHATGVTRRLVPP